MKTVEPLLKADDQTDQATKQLLHLLIKKKLKYNRYKYIHFVCLTSAVLYGFLVFYLMYKTVIGPHTGTVLDVFSILLQKKYFLLLIFIGATLFGSVKIFFDGKEKAGKEFHNLRCEVIDKSKHLWKNESWNQRHLIFEQMKSKYNINLYHESK